MPKIKKKGKYLWRRKKLYDKDPSVFKGIYPREPRNKKRVNKSSTPSTTFYYSRDIQYLLHEPLLAKFRDHKALGKKIARHLGRGEAGDAQRLEQKGASKLSLDHIVKERYPSFADALRDLDDALSLLFLFANLPSTSTVPPTTISLCQRLCREFERYIIASNSLRKSFLSIKGIYYQATIQGQDILWLVPYKFVQRVSQDVDYRIMGTFVEFYTTLLGFVNFRLYTSIGLVYPPRFDPKSDEQGGDMNAFTLEGRGIEERQQIEASMDDSANNASIANEEVQKQIAAIAEVSDVIEDPIHSQDNGVEEDTNDAIDTFEPIGEDADILPQPQASSNEAASLFAPFTFFISRETPKQSLEFILRAFGCKRIGWDAVLGDGAFTNNENDPSITHQIVDRPPLASLPDAQDEGPVKAVAEDSSSTQITRPGYRVPGRIYIQPQWVWDTINQVQLLRPDLYAPGVTMPPHLSPFVRPSKGSYDPSAPLAEQEREGEAEEAEGLEELEKEIEENKESDPDMAKKAITPPKTSTPPFNHDIDSHGMTIAGSDSDSEASSTSATSFAGFDEPNPAADISSESEAETTRTQHQRELEAEAAGLTFSEGAVRAKANGMPVKGILKPSSGKGEEARKRAGKKRREEEEELERRKMMMGRKKRKMVEKMLYSNSKKDEEAARLRGKRRRIEGGKS